MMKLPGRDNTHNKNLREDIAKVIDRRRFDLQSASEYIPMGEGRPKRDGIISQDDINNLRIALATSNSINSFVGIV